MALIRWDAGIGLDLRAALQDCFTVMAEDSSKSHSDPRAESSPLPPPDVAKPALSPSRVEGGSGSTVPLKVSVDPNSSVDDPDQPGSAQVSGQVPGADAALGNRLLATFLDAVVALGLALAVQLLDPFIKVGDQLSWVVLGGYIISRDSLSFLQGQSVGKKAMKLQAVTMEGVSLEGNWRSGLIRNAVLVIPLFVFVELIVLLTRQDYSKPLLRLGDEWANTRVINAGLEILKSEDSGTTGGEQSEPQ